VNTNTW